MVGAIMNPLLNKIYVANKIKQYQSMGSMAIDDLIDYLNVSKGKKLNLTYRDRSTIGTESVTFKGIVDGWEGLMLPTYAVFNTSSRRSGFVNMRLSDFRDIWNFEVDRDE